MASSKLETVKIRPKWELHIDPHFLPTRGVTAIQTNERLIPHMQVSHQGYKNVGPNEKLQLIPSVSLSLSLSLLHVEWRLSIQRSASWGNDFAPF
jgi:hypothetical protein